MGTVTPVGHAVAAGAGGVVAPAHAARVNFLAAVRDSIAAGAGLAVAPAQATRIQLLAAVGNTIASFAGRIVATTHTTNIRRCSHTEKMSRAIELRCSQYSDLKCYLISGVTNLTVTFDDDPCCTSADSTRVYLRQS